MSLDLRLERKVGNPVTVHTLDLGAGGARVVSRRPLRIDEELHFDLDLPEDGRHVAGTARVLRQHPGNAYALRFEHVAPDVMQHLAAVVEARVHGHLA
jgi:hypothetical protein